MFPPALLQGFFLSHLGHPGPACLFSLPASPEMRVQGPRALGALHMAKTTHLLSLLAARCMMRHDHRVHLFLGGRWLVEFWAGKHEGNERQLQ